MIYFNVEHFYCGAAQNLEEDGEGISYFPPLHLDGKIYCATKQRNDRVRHYTAGEIYNDTERKGLEKVELKYYPQKIVNGVIYDVREDYNKNLIYKPYQPSLKEEEKTQFEDAGHLFECGYYSEGKFNIKTTLDKKDGLVVREKHKQCLDKIN